jgi:outer membrane protein assembly factor BamB
VTLVQGLRYREGMYQTFVLVLAIGAFAQNALSGQFDWPQWQGPDRTAHSKETGLLKEWPTNGPPLAWKVNGLGGGDSTPSIAAGRIYGMANRGEDEVVWALSEEDGKEGWSVRIAPAHSQTFPQSKEGPSATPTVDGDRLYVMGLAGNVVCLRAADGKLVWQWNLVTDFGGTLPAWSYRESPLIDGDKLICTPGSEGAMLVALDKSTGQTIWKTQMPGSSESAPGSASNSGGGPGGSTGGTASGVAGTKDPNLFVSEHWGMTAFSKKVPNGKYVAKLYFAETYQGITGPGQRVFSFDVQGHKFKDFDIWLKAGGPNKAYVETVPIEVSNGEFRIIFTSQVENPAIKAIEVIPQGEAAGVASSAGTVRINAGASSSFTDSSGQIWQPDSGFEGGMTNPGMDGAPPALGGAPAGAERGRGRSGGGFGGFGGPGSSGAAYASPIAIDFDGQRQYVQLTAKALIGVAATDGKFLWQYERPANGMGINCSTPIYQDGMVFAASAYGAGGGAVKLSRDPNGAVNAKEVWSSKQIENHHGGVILHDGALFGSNGGNGGGYLICLDFQTGDILWNERDSDKRRVRKGSVAFADGRIYYRTEEGDLILIEPSRKEYLERGRFQQPERTKLPAWAHPVIANGKLYIRDQDTLFCYDVKAR